MRLGKWHNVVPANAIFFMAYICFTKSRLQPNRLNIVLNIKLICFNQYSQFFLCYFTVIAQVDPSAAAPSNRETVVAAAGVR